MGDETLLLAPLDPVRCFVSFDLCMFSGRRTDSRNRILKIRRAGHGQPPAWGSLIYAHAGGKGDLGDLEKIFRDIFTAFALFIMAASAGKPYGTFTQ